MSCYDLSQLIWTHSWLAFVQHCVAVRTNRPKIVNRIDVIYLANLRYIQNMMDMYKASPPQVLTINILEIKITNRSASLQPTLKHNDSRNRCICSEQRERKCVRVYGIVSHRFFLYPQHVRLPSSAPKRPQWSLFDP